MGFSQAFLCFFALLIFLPFLSVSSTVKQIYIIHMKYQYKPFPYATHHDWYSAQLQSLSLTPIHPSFTLTPTQSMASLPNLTRTKPNHSVNPTQSSVFTKTPSIPSTPSRTLEFLGLHTKSSQNTHFLKQASHDVIINILNSDIWPEYKSFDNLIHCNKKCLLQQKMFITTTKNCCNNIEVIAIVYAKGCNKI